MKYFVVPEAIPMLNTITKLPVKYDEKHPQKGEPVVITAHRFVLDNVCSSKDIGKGMEGIRRVRKLDEALEHAKPGDAVGIEDADYNVVMRILAEMEFDSPVYASQLLPLFEAWEETAKHDEKWKREQTLKSVPEEAK